MLSSKSGQQKKPRNAVTLKAVAQHLGLTPGTVSAVLNNSAAARSIPEHTRKRIRAAARELKYRPNFLARSLRVQRTFSIGVIGEEIGDVYGGMVVSGIEACLQEPLTLIGASMSGYTAVKLTRLHEVKNLVLIVPAMYTPEAYEVPFNGGFSEIIRSHRSWERSDAWEILRGFTGKLLVVAAEHDTVIPREVVQRTFESAAQAQFRDLYIVPGASHLGLFAAKAEFIKVVEMIKSMCME